MTSSITGLNDLFRQLSQQASSSGATGAGAAGAAQFLQGPGQDLPPLPPLDGADDADQARASSVAASPLPSQKFSAGVLQILLSAQTASGSQPTASSLANALIQGLDQNSDGSLSLDEVRQALQSQEGRSPLNATSSATSSDPTAQAFAQLDTDGDGQLSAAELTAGLEKLAKDEAAVAAISPHRRHHHHIAEAAQQSDPPAQTTEASADPDASSTSSGDIASNLVSTVTISATARAA